MSNGNPPVALETLPGAVRGGASALRENLRLAYAALWPIPAFAAVYYAMSRRVRMLVPGYVSHDLSTLAASAVMPPNAKATGRGMPGGS